MSKYILSETELPRGKMILVGRTIYGKELATMIDPSKPDRCRMAIADLDFALHREDIQDN